MLNEATRQFVRLHADDDVRRLALQTHAAPDVDLPLSLNQIRGRQIARQKLPSWAEIEEIAYPPHLSMEQCSSEQTAQYKAQLLARFVSTLCKQVHFIDLTGGLGVDFSFIAQAIGACKAVYVERDAHLCELARHNFPLLGLPNAEIVCDTAENYLHQCSTVTHPPSTILFLDPARRDAHGNRTYALADCTPNVLEICDELLKIADFIVLKLSPMLDWHRAVEELGNVSEVHIVSVANECKEMLLVMKKNPENLKIFCVNDQQLFSYEETGTMAQKRAVP
ncbi:MAG: SAM-dependent methyltransferase, partial [Prevotella sp.]|nr:SAM-dependent methyltransferase [Prevotella sp.]